MNTVKTVMHGLVLYGTNVFGAVLGMLVYKKVGGSQIFLQFLAALIVSIAGFTYWLLVAGKMSPLLTVLRPIEYAGIFAAALVWNPAILVPLGYVTHGDLMGAKNLLMMALFQAGGNAIVLGLVYVTRNRIRHRDGGSPPTI